MRIKLQFGIFAIFMGVMLPLIGAMTGILYVRNAKLADDTAQAAMDKSTDSVVVGIRGMLDPIARTVELSAAFGRAQRDSLRRPDSWRPMFEALEQQPNLYSLYYGFARAGEFLQMIRLPAGIEKFGPKGEKPPAEARYVIRTIDDSTGANADSLIYLAGWGDVVKVEQTDAVRYDPRQRPWYTAAQAKDELANSGVYLFSSTGRPGLTLSERIATEDGELIGVFGADISLDALARMTSRQQVGGNGLVFIVDEDNRLIGYPDISRSIVSRDDRPTLAQAQGFEDPRVAVSVARHAEGGGNRFYAEVGDSRYLVSVSHLPDDLRSRWRIYTVIDEEDFIAPIRRVSLLILLIGSTIVLLSGGGVYIASRLLTVPIGQVIAETELIRRLALDEPVQVTTRVAELMQLGRALDNMKSALRSFGAYVPKELVRQIVASGSDSALGGQRQPTTILFTDLAGFTKASESLAPEEVLRRLSDYFEVMASAIDLHHGTIDKYIGDAIMALWNAPVADPEHEYNACMALLACRDAGRRLNAEMARQGLPPLTTRLGLHTGTVVVGNVGSSRRMQYTALGPAVNLASRVEGMNKKFGTELLVTGPVEEAVRGRFLFRPLGPVVASGTSIPMPLFELLEKVGQESGETTAKLAAWMRAFDAYAEGQWSDAVQGFRDFETAWPGDEAALLLAEHCRSLPPGTPVASPDSALRFESK